jgi:DNA modification methylase
MTATVLRADALRLPLADETVDLVVTSPPYFGLRSYTDTPQLCDRCRELTGHGWAFPRESDEHRNLREAWPDWDQHVRDHHKPAHYAGQLGSEATPAEFVDALLQATREMVRVLKPSGSIWVNLGDKYSEGQRRLTPRYVGGMLQSKGAMAARLAAEDFRPINEGNVPAKSLIGIPWRYALACIDQLGLILRAEVIWSKPNGLPESVTDRVRRSHEQWFHFVRQPRYYSAVDEIREGYHPDTARHYAIGYHSERARELNRQQQNKHTDYVVDGLQPNPLGKLPGSVWTIPTEPLTVPAELGVDHFAAFPIGWPRRIIAGWSPSGICVECGEGRRPVAQVLRTVMGGRELPADGLRSGEARQRRLGASSSLGMTPAAIITGYVCACTPYTDYPERRGVSWHDHSGDAAAGKSRRPGQQDSPVNQPTREYHHDRWAPAPTRPAVVLDPFGGTGTVALVADVLGRRGISVDLSADYNRLAAWRTRDPGQRAKAARVAKPPPVIDGQLMLEVGP